MLTQVELISTNHEVQVYWLDYSSYDNVNIRPGRRVKIAEADPFWYINRVFTTLKSISDLPTRARVGTVIELN